MYNNWVFETLHLLLHSSSSTDEGKVYEAIRTLGNKNLKQSDKPSLDKTELKYSTGT